jgi:hypothetical protein
MVRIRTYSLFFVSLLDDIFKIVIVINHYLLNIYKKV